MKRRQFISLTLITASSLAFYGCFKSGPGKTVEKFYSAIEKGEIDNAIGFMSSSTTSTFGEDKMRLFMNEGVKQIKEKQGIKSIKIDSEEITGDTATVNYTITYGDETTENDTLDLIKEEGQWKIAISGK